MTALAIYRDTVPFIPSPTNHTGDTYPTLHLHITYHVVVGSVFVCLFVCFSTRVNMGLSYVLRKIETRLVLLYVLTWQGVLRRAETH